MKNGTTNQSNANVDALKVEHPGLLIMRGYSLKCQTFLTYNTLILRQVICFIY